MVRIILGVIAGFLVWSVLWVGSDAVFSVVSPGWYGKNLNELAAAAENKSVRKLNRAPYSNPHFAEWSPPAGTVPTPAARPGGEA